MTALRCRSVCVTYGDVAALSDVDLAVADGETLAVLGPSGSGKSTLMYAVAGMIPLTRGTIELGGVTVSSLSDHVPPERRSVGMVFQNYALWPHLSAVETVAYPMRRRGQSKGAARAEAERLLGLVGIGALADRRPDELSGGQQQRVGLARALARQADLYLFDEPTAHLDSSVKAAVQAEITRRRSETGAAAIYSTHDSGEAIAVAERLALLRGGRLIQVGASQDVYERPVDEWAARLTGPVSIVDPDTTSVDRTAGDGRSNALAVRPEWIAEGGPVAGAVTSVAYRGTYTEYEVETPIGVIHPRTDGPPRWTEGAPTSWTINRGWMIRRSDTE